MGGTPALVPTGRTETWRELGGPTGVVAPFEVTVVHFAGLRRYEQLPRALREIPNVHVTSAEATDAATACAGPHPTGRCRAAHQPRIHHTTWRKQGNRRPWPGSHWHAGGRGAGGAGISLDELLEEVQDAGGIQADMVVLDAPTPTRGRVRDQLPHSPPAPEPN